MLDQLKTFVNAENKFIADRAKHIVALQELHVTGQLSNSEYEELLDDCKRLDHLDAELLSEEDRMQIEKAVLIMISIVKIAKSI